ncbi:MAG: fatty acid desaturase family protein [Candidatus Binataceae bacterium]
MNLELTSERPGEPRPDDSAQDIPVTIGKDELRELSKVNSWRGAFHIAVEWTLIVGAIFLCQRFWSPLLYIASVVWIGSRQHALMVLMHDGVHYRLFRNRFLNDWLSEISLAWPVLISARAYRRNHFAHHRYVNTERDPDWARRQGVAAWVFPKSSGDLTLLLLSDVSGLGAIGLLRLIGRLMSGDTGVSKGFIIGRYCFYLSVTVLLIWFGATKLALLYWFVPLFTWLIMIFRIRSIAEHSAIESANQFYAQTRSTMASALDRIFIAPKNVHYHLEHHLYPSVPFYRLPKLHALLASKPEFRGAHITETYFGVLRECVEGAAANSAEGESTTLAAFTMRPDAEAVSQ